MNCQIALSLAILALCKGDIASANRCKLGLGKMTIELQSFMRRQRSQSTSILETDIHLFGRTRDLGARRNVGANDCVFCRQVRLFYAFSPGIYIRILTIMIPISY